MNKVLGFLLVCSLCSCSDNQEQSNASIVSDTTAATSLAEPPGADAAAGNSVLTGSMAGYYVENFAGANSHSYEFKFRNGGYTGIYEEYMDSGHNRVILKDVIGDEAGKTITFDQNGTRLTGTITEAGFELGEEMFERRAKTK